jgi:hypothetical protein
MIHQVKLLDFGFDQLLLGEDADQPEAVALGLNDINFRKKQFFLAVSQSIKAFASHIFKKLLFQNKNHEYRAFPAAQAFVAFN